MKKLQKRKEKEEKQLAVQQRKKEKKDRGVQREKTDDSGEHDDAICPICGASYANTGGLWICCDKCLQWSSVPS